MNHTTTLLEPPVEAYSAPSLLQPNRTTSPEGHEASLQQYRVWLSRCAQVCEEASRGNLELRLLHADECGDFAPLMHGLNHLLDMTDAFMRESFACLEHAGQGKFYRRVLLRGMLGSFRNTSKLINQATEGMAQNSAKLKTADQQRVEIANQFESTVQRVVSALSNSAEQVKETASQLSLAAGERDAKSDHAKNASLKTSNAQRQDLHSVVGSLKEASQKIGGVVKLISQIAAQTNLLALNATIEAARAGEAGKGFAVVASEVKSLAQQTTQATEGISREITAMRGTADHTAELVNRMSSTIHTMTELSAQLSQNAGELSTSVDSFLQSIRA